MTHKDLTHTSPDPARIGGFAAIGFAVAIVLGNVIMVPAGLPSTGSPLDEVTAFFGTESGAVGVGSAVAPAAWVLATVFGAGALAVLRRSGREDARMWAAAGFAGLLLQNGAFSGVVAIRLALASTGAEGGPATEALWALHDALFTLNGAFLALALTGMSVAGRRAGLIRRWHGAAGGLAAVLLFGSASLAAVVTDGPGPLGLLGLGGWLIWVLWTVTYGFALLRSTRLPARP
ncbi:2-oxoglutarate/malate transporter [Streptomyces uncialis]|uniref:2-oxoglutarate/malate transporter n=1 Tax=Streptomyces uncialis TaxID=1048205 RepID=UPI0037B941B9